MATGSGPSTIYTSITLQPPLNWELSPIMVGGVMITANVNGQYVCPNIRNSHLATLLGQGWSLAAFTL